MALARLARWCLESCQIGESTIGQPELPDSFSITGPALRFVCAFIRLTSSWSTLVQHQRVHSECHVSRPKRDGVSGSSETLTFGQPTTNEERTMSDSQTTEIEVIYDGIHFSLMIQDDKSPVIEGLGE